MEEASDPSLIDNRYGAVPIKSSLSIPPHLGATANHCLRALGSSTWESYLHYSPLTLSVCGRLVDQGMCLPCRRYEADHETYHRSPCLSDWGILSCVNPFEQIQTLLVEHRITSSVTDTSSVVTKPCSSSSRRPYRFLVTSYQVPGHHTSRTHPSHVSNGCRQHDRVAWGTDANKPICCGATAFRAATKAQRQATDIAKYTEDLLVPFSSEIGSSQHFQL